MKVLSELRNEFPENWLPDLEVFGVNPKAFSTEHELANGVNIEDEIGRVVRNLFNTTPKAKVQNISISFSPNFAEGDFGGKLKLKGTF